MNARDETLEVVTAARFPGYAIAVEPWWAYLWDDSPILPLSSGGES